MARKKIIFFTLILISINSFAGNDLNLVCEGKMEFYTLPLSSSLFDNQVRSYIFSDGKLLSSGDYFPIDSKNCKWSNNSIDCYVPNNDGFSDFLIIDRLSGSIDHNSTVKSPDKKFKSWGNHFKGICKTGKQKF